MIDLRGDVTAGTTQATSRALPAPGRLAAAIPVSADAAALVASSRSSVRRLIAGEDRRLLVLTGPCSIHDRRAALDYATWLQPLRDRFAGALEIVMRVYVQKPRTRAGWPGLVHDPRLDGSGAIGEGLTLARRVLRDVVAIGVPAATEFIDPLTVPFLADFLSWSAIGARTVESPAHRQMASGLPCPVGFKNGTGGRIDVAIDAMVVAGTPHHVLALDDAGQVAVQETAGNRDVHLVLRGGVVPNHTSPFVEQATRALERERLPTRVLIDCSHGNGRGHDQAQIGVGLDVAAAIAAGRAGVLGVMLESHLVPGRQSPGAGRLQFGQSITDHCIGLEDTLRVLEACATAVETRRNRIGRIGE